MRFWILDCNNCDLDKIKVLKFVFQPWNLDFLSLSYEVLTKCKVLTEETETENLNMQVKFACLHKKQNKQKKPRNFFQRKTGSSGFAVYGPKLWKHWPQTLSSWLCFKYFFYVCEAHLNFYMWYLVKWPAVLQTLSRERPGGREGEEGSSRPRGFFCFGGTASEDEAAGEVTGEDVVTRGMTGSEGNKSQEWNLMNYGNRHKKRRRSRWAPPREGRKTLSSIREII